MIWSQAISLAIVQGITEFLPISSSAHLILLSHIMNWFDQGLAFDVAVHLGTLLAIIIFFRRQILVLFFAWLISLRRRRIVNHDENMAWGLLIASIPVMLVGAIAHGLIEHYLRSVNVIITTTIIFALLLWFADSRRGDGENMTWRRMLYIGCAQVLALIPGTSRSGVTMTMGLLSGLSREAASRFALLLSIPVIIAASIFELSMLHHSIIAVSWHYFIVAGLIAFISAYTCLYFFFKYISKIGFFPFVIYRLLLGVVLILLL